MIGLLINLLILVVIVALIFWVLQQFALPEPIGKIVNIVLVVVTVLVIVSMLLGISGVNLGR